MIFKSHLHTVRCHDLIWLQELDWHMWPSLSSIYSSSYSQCTGIAKLEACCGCLHSPGKISSIPCFTMVSFSLYLYWYCNHWINRIQVWFFLGEVADEIVIRVILIPIPERWHWPIYRTSCRTTWVAERILTISRNAHNLYQSGSVSIQITHLVFSSSVPDDWQGWPEREFLHIYWLVSGWCDTHGLILNMTYSISVTLICRLMLNLHQTFDAGIFSIPAQDDGPSLAVLTTRIDAQSTFSSHNW